MRVLFVDRSSAISMWTVVTPVTQALIESGHQVCWVKMCTPSLPDHCNLPGIDLRSIDVSDFAIPASFIPQMLQFSPKFRDLLCEWKPDIVHTHFAVPGIIARWLAKQAGCRVVSTQHELFGSMNPLLRWGVRFTERYVDVITYVSKIAAHSYGLDGQTLANHGKAVVPRHVVIHNSVNYDEILSVVSNVPERVPHKLVCVGRMVKLKGQETLISALPRVIATHPQVHLTLIGAGSDESRLRKLVHDLGLQDHVRFAGWLSREDTLREMATAQAVVIPSTQEGFGLVLVEAILCDTTVVASDIPVFREVTGDGGGEVLWFPHGNAQALAVELINAMDNGIGSQVHDASRELNVELRYSVGRMSMAYLDVYDDLLRRKTPRGS